MPFDIPSIIVLSSYQEALDDIRAIKKEVEKMATSEVIYEGSIRGKLTIKCPCQKCEESEDESVVTLVEDGEKTGVEKRTCPNGCEIEFLHVAVIKK